MKIRLGRDIIKSVKKRRFEYHTPVTKPTDSEISIFERHLERAVNGKGNPKVLIIGPSPELRDLTAKRKLHTTVVADDLELIERTADLMKKRNERERWLEGNLTELPLKDNSFDVIFGDQVVSDVMPFKGEKFYGKMRGIVKNKGFSVIRSVVFSKTEESFERKVSRHFKIVEKEFGKEGIFAEHFPIYFMRPK